MNSPCSIGDGQPRPGRAPWSAHPVVLLEIPGFENRWPWNATYKAMAALIEAIEIKRKNVLRKIRGGRTTPRRRGVGPTARAGRRSCDQDAHISRGPCSTRRSRRARKFPEPDLELIDGPSSTRHAGLHFMDQGDLRYDHAPARCRGRRRFLLVDKCSSRSRSQRRPDRAAVPAARRADGDVHGTRRPRDHRERRRDEAATLRDRAWNRVPLFIKEGKRWVHTEPAEFAGRA